MREIGAEEVSPESEHPLQEVIASQPIAREEVALTREEASVRPKEVVRSELRSSEESVRLESQPLLLPCVVCGANIEGRPQLVRHLEDRHSQRICPICSMPFDSRVSGHEDYFRMHVENHLDSNYPHK